MSPAAILNRTGIASSALDHGIRLADHCIPVSAFWQLITDDGSCPAIHDGRRATDAPDPPTGVSVALVPIDRQANPGSGALRRNGEIRIERRRRIIGWTELHALHRVVKLNLVAPAHHHRVLGRPFEVLPTCESGIL